MMEVDPLKLENFFLFNAIQCLPQTLPQAVNIKLLISIKLKNTQFKPFKRKFIVSSIIQHPIQNFTNMSKNFESFNIGKPFLKKMKQTMEEKITIIKVL